MNFCDEIVNLYLSILFPNDIYSQDELDRPKPRVEIPALAAGASKGPSTTSKLSKAFTIQAIEAKLKALENKKDDFEVNKTSNHEIPIIQRYQYNKDLNKNGPQQTNTKYSITRNKYSSGGPYDRRQRHSKR